MAASASTFVTGLTTTAAEGMGVLVGLGTATTATALTDVSSDGTADAYTSLSTISINHVTGAALANAPAFTGTTATITVSADYTPAGNISGTQALTAHSHTYVTLPAHTHSVGKTDNVEAAISLSAAVSNHTHSIGNHTHSVTI